MTGPLPQFENPPVIEVVLSVQFEPIEPIHRGYIGLLWNEYRERYPTVEEYPPLGQTIEKFGIPKPPKEITVEVKTTTTPPSRIWFKNEAGNGLIQIQNDRFIFNWIKSDDDSEYPRYEAVYKCFKEEFGIFQKFLNRENLGGIIPNQCEVTYINNILGDAVWTDLSQVERFLTVFNPEYSDSFLGAPENVNFATRYIIPDDSGDPIGRLHISVEPRYRRRDSLPLYVMTLTARGMSKTEGIDGAFEFMDIGHEWIVHGFASITTKAMHSEVWRRIENGS